MILLDVNMPDIDGFETAALIRQHKSRRTRRSSSSPRTPTRCRRAQGYSLGAVDYILSPVVPEVLRSKVKVFVELYQMQQRSAQAEERVALRGRGARAPPRRRRGARTSSPTRAASSAPRSTSSEGMRRLLELLVPHVWPTSRALVTVENEAGDARAALARGRRPMYVPGAAAGRAAARAARARNAELRCSSRRGALGEARCCAIRCASGERIVGALALGYAPGRAHAARPGDMLEELVGRAAIALENARLYRSLKREIARSREAEEELQDANRRKDEFLAMLAHELRNPLAPIRNAVELMRRIGADRRRRSAWRATSSTAR